ncbi:MAG TPA: hypothetical protein VGM62_01705 [Chthoniobacterales bacterium]|jgi:predicted AlkP superfamily phosphohydrolase/phosphomutase
MSANDRVKPLVILGVDAGDPQWLRRWTSEGRLPNIGAIMARGCWGETGGSELLLEHGVWQSIFAGISRGKSGYHYFRQLHPGSYDLRLVNGAIIRARPFWDCLGKDDGRIFIADIPDILPGPESNGVQIANWAVHRGWRSRDPEEQPMSQPASALKEIEKLVGPAQLIIENAQSTLEQDREIYRQLMARIPRKGALCRALIGKEKPNVVAVVFGESHSAGHQFWKYQKHGEEVGATSPDLVNGIRSIYEAIDHEIGLLLHELPSDSNVFVISSVGLAHHYPTGQLLEAFCRELGYQVPSTATPASFHPMTVVRRLIPEPWRIGLSRLFSRETRERWLAEQFRSNTDWNKTTAFVIPSIYTGFIRVNLRGREPSGIVEPGQDYESILRQLEADLAKLVDPVTEKPAIEKVIRTAEVFGKDAPSMLPDLIVHWNPSTHFLERVTHPRCDLVQSRPEFNRASDHYEHGFFAAAGPGIDQRGELAEVDTLDLAPTFLRLLNQPHPAWMSGKPVEELLVGTNQSPDLVTEH